MKKIYLLLICFLSNFLISQSLTGVGFQKGINEYWRIDVEIATINNISVSYPSIGCSGKWILLKDDKSGSLFKELITFGEDKCIPEGFVYLTRDPLSTTSYRFYIFENNEDEIPYALGVLEKK